MEFIIIIGLVSVRYIDVYSFLSFLYASSRFLICFILAYWILDRVKYDSSTVVVCVSRIWISFSRIYPPKYRS